MNKSMKTHKRHLSLLAAFVSGMLLLSACGAAGSTNTKEAENAAAEDITESAAENENAGSVAAETEAPTTKTGETATALDAAESYSNDTNGGHAIEIDGSVENLTEIKVTKTGDSDQGDEADFYGDNAAIFATNGATLTINSMEEETNGKHANAVFSYGEGTTVTVSDATITTSGDCSGGLMTTGGGTMIAENCIVTTSGNSSAAIRSDRGGGDVDVNGGSYTTSGSGSPAIYSTADIDVKNATLTSTAAQGVVVEGKNSVDLENCTLIADNNTKNSDKSDSYQAVMIYQSMSGDATEGEGEFSMEGGSLTNKNGDIFFVNNTIAAIDLTNVAITNEDADGLLLRAAAAGWGNVGKNGGQVDFDVETQTLAGDILVDEISKLNFSLSDSSTYTGAINKDGQAGEVYVALEEASTWTLTADSYITSLSCDAAAINLNGHTLYVNGTAYVEGTASTGTEISFDRSSSGSLEGGMPGGEKPDGESGEGMGERPSGTMAGGTPPERPSGEKPSGTPPERPSGEKPGGNPPSHANHDSSESASDSSSSSQL